MKDEPDKGFSFSRDRDNHYYAKIILLEDLLWKSIVMQ